MTAYQALNLIKDIEADYIGMVKELNRIKRLKNPVDPWSMPLVERMEKAKRDLEMAATQPKPTK